MFRHNRRSAAALASAMGVALAMTACSSSSTTTGGDSPGKGKAECVAYEQYGNLTGKKISVYTSIVAPESDLHTKSYQTFESCTGAQIDYDGSKEFETQLPIRLQGNNAPDIAYLPQPGLLNTIVQDYANLIKKAPDMVVKNVDANFDAGWKAAGTVDGTFYAAPLGSNVKSYVWYSPKAFTAAGYKVPATWDEMVQLSDKMVADGHVPWCAGISSGEATGWPATDWLEDLVLRTAGPDTYTKWVKHEIAYDDPQIVAALDKVGTILKNTKYVNGGIAKGDVNSIATTTFQDGGKPLVSYLKSKPAADPKTAQCWMHRQASFYAANFDASVKVAQDGDLWAFYLPATNASAGKPVLTGGEFVAAFSDRPEVQAFQAFLSSSEWANAKAKVGKDANQTGWVSANKNVDINQFSGIDRLSVEILKDPTTVTRFDGSDSIPTEANKAEWRALTDWVKGSKTSAQALQAVQAAWPKS